MPLKDPIKRKAYHDAYSKRWYQDRKEKHKYQQYATRDIRIGRNIEYIREIKAKPCTDCKNIYPYYVMQFDHIDSKNKVIGIAAMRSWGLEKIKREIEKCELVCANCHAERTHQRRITEVQHHSKV